MSTATIQDDGIRFCSPQLSQSWDFGERNPNFSEPQEATPIYDPTNPYIPISYAGVHSDQHCTVPLATSNVGNVFERYKFTARDFRYWWWKQRIQQGISATDVLDLHPTAKQTGCEIQSDATRFAKENSFYDDLQKICGIAGTLKPQPRIVVALSGYVEEDVEFLDLQLWLPAMEYDQWKRLKYQFHDQCEHAVPESELLSHLAVTYHELR